MTNESVVSRDQAHIHISTFLSCKSSLVRSSSGINNSEVCSASEAASLYYLDIQSVHSTLGRIFLFVPFINLTSSTNTQKLFLH